MMATAPNLEILGPSTDIQVLVEANPEIVLLDSEKFDEFYTRVKAETDKLTPDTSTKRGRDEIRSMAAKVTKTKTTIDQARLRLTEQWRTQTNEVNAAWKDMKPRLETLADEVRKPLTDWENAEKERVESCRADIDSFKRAAIVTLDDTAATVRERGKEVWSQAIDPERFGDMAPEAQAAKDTAVETLKAALARLTREEAERAELERLRAEAAERERIEAEQRAQAEAERERAEAEMRQAAEAEAEKERLAQLQRDAEERARAEAERKAEEDRARIQREHEQALAAERRRAEDAEQAAKAERDRAAKEAADRKASEDAAAAEQAKRDKNRAHRAQIMGEAKIAIMAAGKDVSETAAVLIVKAIVGGEIPHVTLRF